MKVFSQRCNKYENIHFGRSLPKAQKIEILNRAQETLNFEIKSTGKFVTESIMNISACSGLIGAGIAVSRGIHELAVMMGSAGLLFRHVCLSEHKNAIRSAVAISKRMKVAGFNKEEIKVVTDKVIVRNGNIVYSKMFKALYPKRMDNIANGVMQKPGFLHVSLGENIKNIRLKGGSVELKH